MTMKMLATGAAAVAAIAAAAAGVTSFASGSTSAFDVQLATSSAPFAQDPPPPPAPDLPTAGELSSLCTNLTNPGVSYHSKNGLVAGGINDNDGRVADHDLREAFRDGKFPQSYDVTNIQPAGPNAATADVAISGPKFPAPISQNLTFVNQGGWTISPQSAQVLIQAASS